VWALKWCDFGVSFRAAEAPDGILRTVSKVTTGIENDPDQLIVLTNTSPKAIAYPPVASCRTWYPQDSEQCGPCFLCAACCLFACLACCTSSLCVGNMQLSCLCATCCSQLIS
jgi:hypothetical protein